MRTSRVFVDLPLSAHSELQLPPAPSRHLLQVLRLRTGAELTVFNGQGGEYQATLLGAVKAAARVRIGAHRALERESALDITLLQSVARGERMDFVMQKAVELGVTRIVPVLTDFSVVKLDAAQAARRLAHWRGIIAAACEQCGRNRLPAVSVPTTLAPAIAALPAGSRRLVLDPEGAASLLTAASAMAAVVLLIGPEGGLSPAELALCVREQFVACRLGPRVLRTETAPLAALAMLQALAGDLG